MSSINPTMAAAVAATSLQAKQESKDKDRATNRSREVRDAIVDLSKPLTEDKNTDEDPLIDSEMPEQGQAAGTLSFDQDEDQDEDQPSETPEPVDAATPASSPKPKATPVTNTTYGPAPMSTRTTPERHAVDVTA